MQLFRIIYIDKIKNSAFYFIKVLCRFNALCIITKWSAKNTETWTTSLFNNAIQNQWALSKADKHNLRKHDALEVIQNEFGSKDDDLER